MTVKFADEVRKYCKEKYIQPAKKRGELVVALRSGDIHAELKYTRKLPLVCACLGSIKFENENYIKRIAVDGPLNGSSTLFVYKL